MDGLCLTCDALLEETEFDLCADCADTADIVEEEEDDFVMDNRLDGETLEETKNRLRVI